MRTERLYFILVFLSLFCAAATALAYRPGPDIIRECPKCGTHLKQKTMMSGNSFGARYWTDGKMLAPMLPDYPWLVKCPECKTFIWIDEAKELGQIKYGKGKQEWLDAKAPELPTEDDFIAMIDSADKLSKKKELYIRFRAWWAANDAIRMKENTAFTFSPAQEANINAIANLLDEKNPDPKQRLIKAEAFRETKQFEKCIKLLSQPFESDNHTEAANFIRSLAEQKIWQVREFVPEKPNK